MALLSTVSPTTSIIEPPATARNWDSPTQSCRSTLREKRPGRSTGGREVASFHYYKHYAILARADFFPGQYVRCNAVPPRLLSARVHCGYHGDPRRACTCTAGSVRRYQ